MYPGLCQSPQSSGSAQVCALQMEKVQFISHTVDTMAGHWALNEVDCVPVTRVVRHKKPRNLHPEFQSGFIKLAELPRTHSTVSTLGFFNFYINTAINTSLLKAAVSSFSFTLEDFRNKNFCQRGGLYRFLHIGVSNFYVYPFSNPSPNIEYS